MGEDKKKKKILTKEDKKNIARCSVLLLVSLVNLTVASVAWFTSNRENDIKPNRFDTASSSFEISTHGIQEDNIFAEQLTQLGHNNDGLITDNGNITGTGGSTVRWFMSDESHMNNYDGNSSGIYPGSYGKTRLFIVPGKDGDLSLNIKLSAVPYTDGGSDNILERNTGSANDFLSGHLMFFRKYSEETGKYSDILLKNENDEMTFTFEIENAVKGQEYPLDIYWIWPDIFGKIILDESDPNLSAYKSIIDSKKDKNAVISDMKDHSERYFNSNSGSIDLGSELKKVC